MGSVKSGSLKTFGSERLFIIVLLIITAAASFLLYYATRSARTGSHLPSYSLQLEMRSVVGKTSFNFVHGCIYSETGQPCRSGSTYVDILPGTPSFVNLSSDLPAGNYHGIRLQLRGSNGDEFYLKSISLQGRRIFDGSDFSMFRNMHGFKILKNRENGLIALRITSDSASFDLDCSFRVEPVPGETVKYPDAVIISVLLVSLILLCSAFHKSVFTSPGNEEGKDSPSLGKSPAHRIVTAIMLGGMLALVLHTGGRLFVPGEFTVIADSRQPVMFNAEVSGSPNFGQVAGSRSFFSRGRTMVRVPGNFSDVRLSEAAGSPGAAGFMAVTSSGSCGIKDGQPVRQGGMLCRADSRGRLYFSFDSAGDILTSIVFSVSVLLLSAGAAFAAFRLLDFGAAVRLMLVFILISAYIAGETCLNVEQDNVIFFSSYLELLSDTVLRNISLILFMLILSVLAFSKSRISSSVSILALFLIVLYVALDWGVTSNFGVRADFSNISSHTGADSSTVLVFASNFLRNSGASWMALVMLADICIMAFSFRLRENPSFGKYLILLLVLNSIPFLKVYENSYTPGSLRTREDIFDIQRGYLQDADNVYTDAFPLYDWKPDYKIIDGLGRRKNVVILSVESLANSYSMYFSGLRGYTPNVDRLAGENVSFVNYHSSGQSTVPAVYSMMTGKVFFSMKPADLRFEYGEALPKIMRSEGYSTSAIYSAEDFAGLGDVYRNSGFEHLYGPDEAAYEGEKRGVFNSVADGVLLSHAADLIKGFDNQGRPHLTFIMTTTSHHPFTSPETGRNSYEETISYVDREIGKFVRKLVENGFFDRGTLIITGDHIPPGLDLAPGELARYGDDLNRVPLIIIDRDLGKERFNNVFGHDSLKAIIEYLNLKKVRKYEYQLIPFLGSDRDRGVTVLCPMHLVSTYTGEVRVSGPNGEQGIYSEKGDRSVFIGHFLSPDAEKEVAGRVKWFKLEK